MPVPTPARTSRVAISLIAATLALGTAACGSSGSGAGAKAAGKDANTVKIMVGGLDKQIYLPFKLAEQLGFYKAAGVNVQLSDEPAGVDAENEMLSGNVDGVGGFYDHNVDLQAKGKSTEAVVQMLQAPGEVEMVRADEASSITSPAAFSGKRTSASPTSARPPTSSPRRWPSTPG